MLEVIKNAVWGPATAINILLLGLMILIKTNFKTIVKLPSVFKSTICSVANNRKSFSLMCTSLGGTIGVGNAIGVAGAILEGGAGAVFWMGVAGILGMAVKYAEVYLSMIYKGPIMYIKNGVNSKTMSVVYAILCIAVSFGMGNTAQVKAAMSAIDGILPVSTNFLYIIMAFIFLWIIQGGLEKIRKYSEYAIPAISAFYIILLVLIVIMKAKEIPQAMKTIITDSGILAGFKWSLLKKGIGSGFSKAIFSSEAGLGSVGFTHNESDALPNQQAKWGIVEVFIDSLICILTSVALLAFGSQLDNASHAFMTKGIFALSFGKSGEIFYGISMFIFAFSSILCWYYNGLCALKFLTNNKNLIRIYCFVHVALIILAGNIGESTVINLADVANGLMMTVNLSALWVLVFKNSLTF